MHKAQHMSWDLEIKWFILNLGITNPCISTEKLPLAGVEVTGLQDLTEEGEGGE